MSINDLLATIIQKKQLDMQQAAHELAKQQLVLSTQQKNAATFDALSRTLPSLNPEQRRAYALGIAHSVGLDDQTAVTAAEGAVTNPEVFKSNALAYLIQNNPQQALTDIGNMAATGRTPGTVSAENDYLGMTPEEHAQAGRIKGGVALSAPEQANVDVGLANIRQNYAALANQWNIAKLGFDARVSTAKDPMHATALIGNLTQLLNNAGGATKTLEGRRAYNAAINTVIQQLAEQGIIVPLKHLDKDGHEVLGLSPDADINAPGFFGAIQQIPGAIKDAASGGH